jgi:molybdenum cofactor cytidylyltransferase
MPDAPPSSTATPRVAAIVLAAGASRRLGESKALLPLSGRSLIARLVGTVALIESIRPLIVVTGHERQHIHEALAGFDVTFAHNDNHHAGGMISSVKTGVQRVADLIPPIDAFFILLLDQPMVQHATYQALINAWNIRRSRAAFPSYNGKHGHPILFDARAAKEILFLSPDATLHDYTSGLASEALDVPVNDVAVLDDIDTPADVQRLLARRAEPWPIDPSAAAKRATNPAD